MFSISAIASYSQSLSGWRRYLTALLLGVLATLALPPLYWLPLLIPAFSGFFWLSCSACNSRQAFATGWWFGLGHFASGLYWINHALLVDAEKFGWMIPFAVVGINGALACYPALVSLGMHYCRKMDLLRRWLLFALLWGGAEYLRSVLFTGFPWNLIAYSWTVSDITIQWFAWGDVFLVGICTVLLVSLPVIAGYRRLIAIIILGAICVTATGYWRVNQASEQNVPGVRLRIVQASIPQQLKWDPEFRFKALEQHIALSRSEGWEDITHIIWPESAMPFAFRSHDRWAQMLTTAVPDDGVLLTGVTRIQKGEDGEVSELFNSMQVMDHKGKVMLAYDKAKLVPFGEFVPLREWIPVEKITHGALDFSSGISGANLTLPGMPPIRPLICYEAIFPELVSGAHPAWLLNVTNDGWFGDSAGPHQHLQMSRVRGGRAGGAAGACGKYRYQRCD